MEDLQNIRSFDSYDGLDNASVDIRDDDPFFFDGVGAGAEMLAYDNEEFFGGTTANIVSPYSSHKNSLRAPRLERFGTDEKFDDAAVDGGLECLMLEVEEDEDKERTVSQLPPLPEYEEHVEDDKFMKLAVVSRRISSCSGTGNASLNVFDEDESESAVFVDESAGNSTIRLQKEGQQQSNPDATLKEPVTSDVVDASSAIQKKIEEPKPVTPVSCTSTVKPSKTKKKSTSSTNSKGKSTSPARQFVNKKANKLQFKGHNVSRVTVVRQVSEAQLHKVTNEQDKQSAISSPSQDSNNDRSNHSHGSTIVNPFPLNNQKSVVMMQNRIFPTIIASSSPEHSQPGAHWGLKNNNAVQFLQPSAVHSEMQTLQANIYEKLQNLEQSMITTDYSRRFVVEQLRLISHAYQHANMAGKDCILSQTMNGYNFVEYAMERRAVLSATHDLLGQYHMPNNHHRHLHLMQNHTTNGLMTAASSRQQTNWPVLQHATFLSRPAFSA